MTLSVQSRPRATDAARLPSPARSRRAARLRRRVAATWRELVRSRVVPAAELDELAFEQGERVLSVSRDREGECTLVATDRALYHRVRGVDADGWSRLGWEQIARIGWDSAAGQLVITGLSGGAPARMLVPLRHRGSVPELAQERVTHTRLGQRHLLIAGTHRAVIQVRRRPVTGELLWFVIHDASATSGDGDGDIDIGAHVEQAIAQLCVDFGVLPPASSGGVDQVV